MTLPLAGALIPISNHGIPTMSMGYLVPKPPPDSTEFEGAIVWRGLMVQKAVQQLLFDVDWRNPWGSGSGLDVLIIDMPPGTGDVPLTLGQLVIVDGSSASMTYIQHIDCHLKCTRRSDCLNSTGRCTNRRKKGCLYV